MSLKTRIFTLIFMFLSAVALLAVAPAHAAPTPYDVQCGVPIPNGVVVRKLPDPNTCNQPITNALLALARKDQITPPNAFGSSNTKSSFGAFSANSMPAMNTYEENESGYLIVNDYDSTGVLSYMGATYPETISNPPDGHTYQLWSEVIQPARACNSAGIFRARNDVRFLGGTADLFAFVNGCTGATNYTWGLNDPGVQQQIIITTQIGPVAAANIQLTGGNLITPCFTSRVFNKVTSMWNTVVETCAYDGGNSAGYVEFDGKLFGQSPLWCPIFPASPWVEATLVWKNGAWRAPDTGTHWQSRQTGTCVTTNDSYIVTNLTVDPTYGAYITWARQ